MLSPHAKKRTGQRSICLQLVEAMVDGRWPGTLLRGKEELALPLRDGRAVVVKFRDASRQEVATVYIREADQEVRLARERASHHLPVEKWKKPRE